MEKIAYLSIPFWSNLIPGRIGRSPVRKTPTSSPHEHPGAQHVARLGALQAPDAGAPPDVRIVLTFSRRAYGIC